jgi:hypothetical protein
MYHYFGNEVKIKTKSLTCVNHENIKGGVDVGLHSFLTSAIKCLVVDVTPLTNEKAKFRADSTK